MSESTSAESSPLGGFFVRQWNVYERMVRANLLCHVELFAALREELLGISPNFSILDLGCGDASSLAKALTGIRVSKCVAIDVAGGPLLLAARDNLRFKGIPAEVKQGDILEHVSAPPKRGFDAVTVAYALHHLLTADKERFFKGVAQWVKPGGSLWLIDEIMPSEMVREGWLAKMLEHLHQAGGGIYSPEEWATIDAHVQACDFPETAAGYQRMASEAGFASGQIRLITGSGLLGMMRFTR